MTGSQPKQLVQWLALAEYWFNTNYHTSLKMFPFQALYGYQPPHLVFPIPTPTSVETVEDYLQKRDLMLQLLKHDLSKAQKRMKFFADQKRSDMEFAVGDMVFLKLQPYIQTPVVIRKNFKLSSKYFGSFEILQRIGVVAYKLKLLVGSRIHPIFHVSHLKKKIGLTATTLPQLPLVDHNGHFVIEPEALLQRRLTLRSGLSIPQVLIQCSNSPPEDATWEDTTHIQAQFSNFILEDKDA
ncbi:uncharacterized protein LOC113349540 [Papaver somniferum]|uniref:uncharacterized protein LOC113349540 n=1 Tax=Papaver somniferum TaxID=3469 RepID=UPI000E703E75|nr:uncharacterized protein LOC113349540 [Papaver somniferum]